MNEKELLKRFGAIVKEKRTELKYSQEKFAEISGFHRTYIGLIERGERNISLKNIAKIANAFDISIYELFSELK